MGYWFLTRLTARLTALRVRKRTSLCQSPNVHRLRRWASSTRASGPTTPTSATSRSAPTGRSRTRSATAWGTDPSWRVGGGAVCLCHNLGSSRVGYGARKWDGPFIAVEWECAGHLPLALQAPWGPTAQHHAPERVKVVIRGCTWWLMLLPLAGCRPALPCPPQVLWAAKTRGVRALRPTWTCTPSRCVCGGAAARGLSTALPRILGAKVA